MCPPEPIPRNKASEGVSSSRFQGEGQAQHPRSSHQTHCPLHFSPFFPLQGTMANSGPRKVWTLLRIWGSLGVYFVWDNSIGSENFLPCHSYSDKSVVLCPEVTRLQSGPLMCQSDLWDSRLFIVSYSWEPFQPRSLYCSKKHTALE